MAASGTVGKIAARLGPTLVQHQITVAAAVPAGLPQIVVLQAKVLDQLIDPIIEFRHLDHVPELVFHLPVKAEFI